jgi:hypothetical protein
MRIGRAESRGWWLAGQPNGDTRVNGLETSDAGPQLGAEDFISLQ